MAKTVGVIRESGGSGYSATWWLNSKESGGNLVALSLSADRCTGKINNQTNKVVDILFLEYTLYWDFNRLGREAPSYGDCW